MPGQPIKLGPFVGGMNTYSGPSSVDDSEAVDLLNFDIDLDGSLSSRPGLEFVQNAGVSNQRSTILGSFRSKLNIVYIIVVYEATCWAYNTSNNTWSKIVDGAVTSVSQYNDKLYVVLAPSGTTQGGFSWNGTASTAVANMPRGYSSCIYKERMFISASRNGDESSINRVKFSAAGNPDNWTSTDYFDVSAGDGDDIEKLYVYQASIVIFKSDSTYIYAYESAPTKGQVQIVSSTIGTNNSMCLVEYENNLFTMHESNVYRISNWNWEHANIKVPFVYSNVDAVNMSTGASLSILGNRIICQYFDNYYVLGLKTGAWTRWKFKQTNRTPSNFIVNPIVDPTIGIPTFFGGSKIQANSKNLYIFRDNFGSTETFDIKLVTKAYDFGPSYTFKRLFWWGVDIMANTSTRFKVSPVVYSVPTTWGQVKTVPISQLQTWGRPLDLNLDVTDSANIQNISGIRVFVKLLKSLRFRQASFTIEASTAGNIDRFRIFSLTATVDSKELVVKKVS